MDPQEEAKRLQIYNNEASIRRLTKSYLYDHNLFACGKNIWSTEKQHWLARAKLHTKKINEEGCRSMTLKEVARFMATSAIPGWSKSMISSVATCLPAIKMPAKQSSP
ncbi:hypothetical protein TruAng_000509 [Truncatella angustata]|nr:hypothetical protein TruAng_000509 [Truncatella angustata]